MAGHANNAPTGYPPPNDTSLLLASLPVDITAASTSGANTASELTADLFNHANGPLQQQQHHQQANVSHRFDMAPPPESTHQTFAELHAFAQSHAAAHGYALSINTTAKNRNRVKLACVCYGAPKNTHHLTPETRVRKNRSSAKTGCRMWIDGKKTKEGTWMLRVGEAAHNHEGRDVEGWAVHRRRTWALESDGAGGVTTAESGAGGPGRGGIVATAEAQETPEAQLTPTRNSMFGRNSAVGETVWHVVEAEMAKGAKGDVDNGVGGRDRGVGRTVKVLQEKLPGIRIFKRDVYNIRAQIKKARKAGAVPGLHRDQLPEHLELQMQMGLLAEAQQQEQHQAQQQHQQHQQHAQQQKQQQQMSPPQPSQQQQQSQQTPQHVRQMASVDHHISSDGNAESQLPEGGTHPSANVFAEIDPQLVEQCGTALRESRVGSHHHNAPRHHHHQIHRQNAPNDYSLQANSTPQPPTSASVPPPHSQRHQAHQQKQQPQQQTPQQQQPQPVPSQQHQQQPTPQQQQHPSPADFSAMQAENAALRAQIATMRGEQQELVRKAHVAGIENQKLKVEIEQLKLDLMYQQGEAGGPR